LPPGPLAVARLAIHDQFDNGYAIVEVRTGVSLARVIAARMMSVASPQADDIVDAVAELGNIAGGNVKTLLCHHARLSLPTSEITEQAPYAEPDPDPGGAYVRAIVLGHVAQLAVQPDAAIDGLFWPPYFPEEILERSL
jgi:Chemotaxis phosphatase CheX